MNNMIWDAVLWLRKKLSKDKEDIIEAVNNIQNLFETSADATASSSDILAGKTAYNGTVLLTGSMKDRRGITVTAGATTQDDEYTYLTIPEEACFNASSKLRTKNSNISQRVEIPITIRSDWYFTASSEENYAGNQTTFTLVIEDKKARVIGNTSVTATAPASRYSKATATATIGAVTAK